MLKDDPSSVAGSSMTVVWTSVAVEVAVAKNDTTSAK
jgi:hypothetical protein